MEMDHDYRIFHEENMNVFDELISQDLVTTFRESFNQYEPLFDTKETMKTSRWNSSPNPNILCFKNTNTWESANPDKVHGDLINMKPKDEVIFPEDIRIYRDGNNVGKLNYGHKRDYGSRNGTSHARDHILAERKRREKLNEHFIALSYVVPGLKKMDKAYVLGGAVSYVKELQKRVNELEEQTKNDSMESVILVKKSQFCDDNNDYQNSSQEFPELELRVARNDVLIRIHCRNQRGFLGKILKEVEELQLSVVNSSVVPFGTSFLDITIVAQMENEHGMTMKEIVKILRPALFEFM